MLWSVWALSLVIALVAACTPLGGQPASDSRVLHIHAADRLVGIDPVHGTALFALPRAVASPGGERIFVSNPDEGGTRVDARRGENAGPVSSVSVSGDLEVLAASSNGRLVALGEAANPETGWLAPPRSWSTITIADVEKGTYREYRLPGNYVPEAFGFRDDRLFVVEYLPALAPERYRVRQLDLSSGQVLLVGGRTDKSLPNAGTPTAIEEEMRGRSRMQVMAPDHTRLYTLYLHDDEHLHRRDYPELGGIGRPNPDVHAFVHVLSLTDGWAYCLDLPSAFGQGPADAYALTVSADGRRLYLVDTSTRALVTADTESLTVRESRSIDGLDGVTSGASASLRVGRDGSLYLASGQAFFRLDLQGAVKSRSSLLEPAEGLELSGDGRKVFVVGKTLVMPIDARTAQPLGPGASLAAVGPRRLVEAHRALGL